MAHVKTISLIVLLLVHYCKLPAIPLDLLGMLPLRHGSLNRTLHNVGSFRQLDLLVRSYLNILHFPFNHHHLMFDSLIHLSRLLSKQLPWKRLSHLLELMRISGLDLGRLCLFSLLLLGWKFPSGLLFNNMVSFLSLSNRITLIIVIIILIILIPMIPIVIELVIAFWSCPRVPWRILPNSTSNVFIKGVGLSSLRLNVLRLYLRGLSNWRTGPPWTFL